MTGLEETVSEMLSKIRTEYVHLSFDADFIDGDEFYATGYVMPGGLSASDAEYIIRTVAQNKKIVSADFVEYDPHRDENGGCSKIFLRLMKTFFVSVR